LANHRQRAADEVAVAVGKVAVITLHQRIETETPILTKGNLAQQKIAKHVGGEEILFVLPVLIAENRAGAIDGLGLEGAEGVEDSLGADDVAA
jgi:hypothetical protein